MEGYEITVVEIASGSSWTSFTSNNSYSSSSGLNGKCYIIKVKARDNAGNRSSEVTGNGITIDTTVPVASSLTVPSWAGSSFTASVSASDSVSGIDYVTFSCNGSSSQDSSSPYEATFNCSAWSAGSYAVTVQARDKVGNLDTNNLSATVGIDHTAPTGTSISIKSNATYTNTTSVPLTLAASDSQSGMGQMCFKNESGSYSSWESYGTSKSWTLSTGDGTKTVTAQFKDQAGNTATASDTIVLDTTLPTAPGTVTASPYATTLNWSWGSSSDTGSGLDGYEVYVVEYPGGAVKANWSFVSGTSYSSSGTNGCYYTFSVRARDKAGNRSSQTDGPSITLDTIKPVVSSLSVPAWAGSSFTATASVSDTGSGIDYVTFSCNGSSYQDSSSPYEATFSCSSWTEGSYTVTVQARDKAGNTDIDNRSAAVGIDHTSPTGSISIKSGASYTNTTSVTLTLNATDNTGGSGMGQMCFKNESSSYSSWETYTTSKSWTLSTGDGTKTVTVQYKDQAGNTGTASDTIVLDTVAPTTPGTVSASPYATTLSWSWGSSSDSGSGMDGYEVYVVEYPGGAVKANWASVPGTSYTLSGTNGYYYTFSVRAKDQAGNRSSQTDGPSITIDTAKPVVSSLTVPSWAGASLSVSAAASDGGSGIDYVTFSCNGSSQQDSTSPYDATFNCSSWTEGSYTVTVQARDKAGNIDTDNRSASVGIDHTAPSGTVRIKDNATYTTSTSVTLTPNATDNTGGSGMGQMCFKNESDAYSSWEPYATSKSWTLLTGDGTKTVTAQYKDQAGNTVTCNDTIILDTISPTVPGTPAGNLYGSTLSWTWTASTDLNGIKGYHVQLYEYPLNQLVVTDFVTTTSYSPSGDNGKAYYIKIWAEDNAGKTSSIVQGSTITLDTLAPTISTVSFPSWASNSFQVTASVSDAGSGVAYVRFSCNGTTIEDNTSPYSASFDTSNTSLWPAGVYTISVQAWDNVANPSTISTATVNIERSAPTGYFEINNNAAYTQNQTVTLNLYSSDTGGSNAIEMQFANEAGGYSGWEAFTSSKTWTLSENCGEKTVRVQYRDGAGNIYSCAAKTIIWDNIAPFVPSPVAGNGQSPYYTNNPNFTWNWTGTTDSGGSGLKDGTARFNINLVAYPNPTPIVNWGAYGQESYSHTGADGKTYVFGVRAHDMAGNTTEVAGNSVMVDMTPPEVTVITPAAVHSSLSISAEVENTCPEGEGASPINYVVFECDGNTLGGPLYSPPYSISNIDVSTWAEGGYIIWAKVVDKAGNERWNYSYIDVDRTKPNGTIAIMGPYYTKDNGATSQLATKDCVYLELSADGTGSSVVDMAFSTNGVDFDWVGSYNINYEYPLSGDNGFKKVYAMFKDEVGNISDAVMASLEIYYDNVAPNGSFSLSASTIDRFGKTWVTPGTYQWSGMVTDYGMKLASYKYYIYKYNSESSQLVFESPINKYAGFEPHVSISTESVAFESGYLYTLDMYYSDLVGNQSSYRSQILCDQNPPSEVKNYWHNVSVDLGRAGTASINPGYGSLSVTCTDLEIKGPGPALKVVRSYPAGTTLGYCYNWDLNVYSWVSYQSSDLVWRTGGGAEYVFKWNGTDQKFEHPVGMFANAEKKVDGSIVITTPDQTEYLFYAPAILNGGKLSKITDRYGNAQVYSYTDNKLTLITQTLYGSAVSKRIKFVYDGNGKLYQITDDTNTKIYATYTYSNNLLDQVILPSGYYNANGENVSLRINYVYDEGNLTEIRVSDATGVNPAVTRFVYGTEHIIFKRVKEVFDAEQMKKAEAERKKIRFIYGDLSTEVYDQNDHRTLYKFDTAGNCTEVTDGLGRVTKVSYNKDRQPTSILKAGTTSSYEYDLNGNLTKETKDAGTGRLNLVTSYNYDSYNNLTMVQDPRGNQTNYNWSVDGNCLNNIEYPLVTDETGNSSVRPKTTFTYYPTGLKETECQMISATESTYKKWEYDDYGNVTKVIERISVGPEKNAETFYYYDPTKKDDIMGRVSKVTDPRGYWTEYTYYPDGSLKKESRNTPDEPGNVGKVYKEYTYDRFGNKHTEKWLGKDDNGLDVTRTITYA